MPKLCREYCLFSVTELEIFSGQLEAHGSDVTN